MFSRGFECVLFVFPDILIFLTYEWSTSYTQTADEKCHDYCCTTCVSLSLSLSSEIQFTCRTSLTCYDCKLRGNLILTSFHAHLIILCVMSKDDMLVKKDIKVSKRFNEPELLSHLQYSGTHAINLIDVRLNGSANLYVNIRIINIITIWSERDLVSM